MKLFKQTLNYAVMLALSGVLFYLTQDAVETIEVFKDTDYADVAGCNPEVAYNNMLCG